MDQRRYPWQTAVVGVIALVALAACSSSPAASAGPGSTATVAPGATAAPGATVAPTAPTTALPSVDLVLSGGLAVTAKGTKGQCTLGKDSTGKVVAFGFNAVEADYPGLGADGGSGLYVSEGTNGFVNIKWLATASTGFQNVADQKGVSADHHSITIDVDLGGGTSAEHIKGTITCP